MGLVVYIFLIAGLLRLWDCGDFEFNLKERLARSCCGFKEMLEVKSHMSKNRGKYKNKIYQKSYGFGGPAPLLQTLEGWQHWRYLKYVSRKDIWLVSQREPETIRSDPWLHPPPQHVRNSPLGTHWNHRSLEDLPQLSPDDTSATQLKAGVTLKAWMASARWNQDYRRRFSGGARSPQRSWPVPRRAAPAPRGQGRGWWRRAVRGAGSSRGQPASPFSSIPPPLPPAPAPSLLPVGAAHCCRPELGRPGPRRGSPAHPPRHEAAAGHGQAAAGECRAPGRAASPRAAPR